MMETMHTYPKMLLNMIKDENDEVCKVKTIIKLWDKQLKIQETKIRKIILLLSIENFLEKQLKFDKEILN